MWHYHITISCLSIFVRTTPDKTTFLNYVDIFSHICATHCHSLSVWHKRRHIPKRSMEELVSCHEVNISPHNWVVTSAQTAFFKKLFEGVRWSIRTKNNLRWHLWHKSISGMQWFPFQCEDVPRKLFSIRYNLTENKKKAKRKLPSRTNTSDPWLKVQISDSVYTDSNIYKLI